MSNKPNSLKKMSKNPLTSGDGKCILEILENNGKVWVYTFTTPDRPGYIKVGFTTRPVSVRIKEWQNIYTDVKFITRINTIIDEKVYVNDHAFHKFFKNNGFEQWTKIDDKYNSNEFFKIILDDVYDAWYHIQESYYNGSSEYVYYNVKTKLKEDIECEPIRDWNFTCREHQKDIISNISKIYKNGKQQILVYASPRSGKTHCIPQVMLPEHLDLKYCLVLTAKPSVKNEWKNAIKKHVDFEDFVFIDRDDLIDENCIQDLLNEGKRVVCFLSLQDISGKDKNGEIKELHKEVFDIKSDILVIDESHYGANAEVYGQSISNDVLDNDIESIQKKFKTNCKIYLSGTPFRMLVEGKFNEDEIACVVTYEHLLYLKKKWYEDNPNEPIENNPYYDFVEPIYFSFTSNIMKDILKNVDGDLDKLFSTKKESPDEFVYEKYVIKFLKILDSSEKFGFLGFDEIKDSNICNHLIMTFNNRTSCDAMKKLLETHKFKNLSKYVVLNFGGKNPDNKFKSSDTAKNAKNFLGEINRLDNENKKTITLTCRKLLTGTTCPEWDTIMMLKNINSPEEYYQEIQRVNTPYKVVHENGTIYIRKPNSIIFDPDSDRMLIMTDARIKACSINKNSVCEEIKNRTSILTYTPMFIFDENGSIETTIKKVTLNNWNELIKNVTSRKNIINFVHLNDKILNNECIKKLFDILSGIDPNNNNLSDNVFINSEKNTLTPTSSSIPSKKSSSSKKESEDEKNKRIWTEILNRILLRVLTINKKLESINDFVQYCSENENQSDRFFFIKDCKNSILSILDGIISNLDGSSLYVLESKILEINTKVIDEDITPTKYMEIVSEYVNKISDMEIITPINLVKTHVNNLNEKNIFNNVKKILVLASRCGEYETELSILKEKYGYDFEIHVVPTSEISYEIIKFTCEMLNISTSNIMKCGIIEDIKNEIYKKGKSDEMKKLKNEKFDLIIGNPPYQLKKQNTSDEPIYNKFYNMCLGYNIKGTKKSHDSIAPIVSLITPGRFLIGGGKTPNDWNKRMRNDEHFSIIFVEKDAKNIFGKTVNIEGHIVIGLWNENEIFDAKERTLYNSNERSIIKKIYDNNYTSIKKIINPCAKFNLNNLYNDYPEYKNKIGSNGKEKRLTSNIFSITPKVFNDYEKDNNVGVLLNANFVGDRQIKYIDKQYLMDDDSLNLFKLVIPKSNKNGLGNPEILQPGFTYNQTFIGLGKFKNEYMVENLKKYLYSSKFTMFLLMLKKCTQSCATDVWEYVPYEDFTNNNEHIKWDVTGYSDWICKNGDVISNVSNFDKQFYIKYGLSDEDVRYIEINGKLLGK